jgi:hypothetical protein
MKKPYKKRKGGKMPGNDDDEDRTQATRSQVDTDDDDVPRMRQLMNRYRLPVFRLPPSLNIHRTRSDLEEPDEEFEPVEFRREHALNAREFRNRFPHMSDLESDEENASGNDDSDSDDDDIEPYDEDELERRIASLNNNNGNVPQQGGRKRRKTTRKRKSAKKRKTTRKKGGIQRKRKTTKNRTGGTGSDDEIINPLWEQQKVEDPTFTNEDVNKLIDEANKKISLLGNDESFTKLTSEDMENTKNLITDLTAAKKTLGTGRLNLNDEDKGRLTGALGMLKEWYSWRIDPVVRWRRGGRSKKTTRKKNIRKRKTSKK